jgi:hypothetical protein
VPIAGRRRAFGMSAGAGRVFERAAFSWWRSTLERQITESDTMAVGRAVAGPSGATTAMARPVRRTPLHRVRRRFGGQSQSGN